MAQQRFLYPTAEDANLISHGAKCAKIARNSICSSCECWGLHPNSAWTAVADDSDDVDDILDAAGSSDDLTDEGFLKYCACGHSYEHHGCDELDRDEFGRRSRVAVRIDALLEEKGRLLDFQYEDDDIVSLRRQMILPSATSRNQSRPGPRSDRSFSSALSDAPPSVIGHKRTRSGSSSLTDEDEDDQPLATRRAPFLTESQTTLFADEDNNMNIDVFDPVPELDSYQPFDQSIPILQEQLPQTPPPSDSPRAGKGIMGLGQVSLAPQIAGENDAPAKVAAAAAVAEAKAKAEVRRVIGGADEGQQVARLATGVTVDAGALSSGASKRERPSEIEERTGIIRFDVVDNDGSIKNGILLTGLKCLFQKQLPNMPREYITRLVFDRNAQALAIVQRGYKVIGGIAYRPFPQRQFAEIVFFAIDGRYQVNGYGGHLMNHFKSHIRQFWPTINHFLTYADNFAIGYFKKQGFKREITLPRELWVGYIKDYEGGTLMQCTMLPKVDYMKTRDLLQQQRDAIIVKIRELSKSHVIHRGLSQFTKSTPSAPLAPKDVPGLKETGWTHEMDELLRRPGRGIYYMAMKRLLAELTKNEASWPFLQPVNTEEVTDYLDVVHYPMDLATMEAKLETASYNDFEGFVADARLMFSNCKLYNHETSQYVKLASRMEKFLDECLAKMPSYRSEVVVS